MEPTEKSSNKYFLYFAIFSVNLISVISGATFSWASTAIPKLHNNATTPLPKPTTREQEAWIVALPALGATIGPILACYCSQKFGKKMTLLSFGIPMVIAHLLYISAASVYFFFCGAFLTGLGNGCIFTILPAYVGEIAENSNRGFLSAIMTILMNLGILMSYSFGPFATIEPLSWILLAFALAYYVCFGFFVPESPYYFISINKNVEAEESLRKLRNQSKEHIQKELKEITDFVTACSEEEVNLREILKSGALRKAFFIMNCLLFVQQFAGIGSILGYMESIFAAAGSSLPPQYSVIIVGSLQFVANCVSSYFVDSLGRRKLLIISKTLCFFAIISLATYFHLFNNNYDVANLSWLPTLSLTVFLMGFSSGLSTVPWVVMGEVFPDMVKSACNTFLVSMTFIYTFAINLAFPYLNASIGIASTFWIFSLVLAAGIFFSLFVMVETKGKSFQEIQLMLSGEDVKDVSEATNR